MLTLKQLQLSLQAPLCVAATVVPSPAWRLVLRPHQIQNPGPESLNPSKVGINKGRRLRLPGGAARKAQLEAHSIGLNILSETLHACPGHPWHRNVEHLEALLFERKSATQRHFRGNRQWSVFLDPDGLCMVLHCNHRRKASKDNGNCPEGLIPATAIQMNDEEMKNIY